MRPKRVAHGFERRFRSRRLICWAEVWPGENGWLCAVTTGNQTALAVTVLRPTLSYASRGTQVDT